MFMVAVVAAVAAAPIAEPPKGSAQTCGATIEKVELTPGAWLAVPMVPSFGWSPEARQQALVVSHIIGDGLKAMPPDEGKLPKGEAGGHGPAVLLPDCKPEPRRKRKKRLSDYPMA